MYIFDTILIVILAGFLFYGLFKGVVRMIGDLAGLIIGAWIASHYYLAFAGWLASFNLGSENVIKIIAFIVLFGVASKLVGFIFMILEKAFKIISIIPFVKFFNKVIGGILGLLLGSLGIGLIIYVISKYAWIGTKMALWLEESQVAPILLNFANLLLPLLPKALKMLEGII